MSKHINVNPDHYKVGGRERQGEDVIHEVERREAKRVRQGQRNQQPAVGISNRMSPDDEAHEAAEHPPVETGSSAGRESVDGAGEQPTDQGQDHQTSRKAGARSMGQKEAGTRHANRSAPPSREVEGAFGRERPDREDEVE